MIAIRTIYKLGLYLVLGLSLLQCTTAPSPTLEKTYEQQIKTTAESYFKTFSDRKDWKKLLSFYREDLQFHDIQLHIELDSLWQFKRFYNWQDTGFQKLSPDQAHLTLESLVVQDSTAVARGHLNPFYFHGELIDSDWGMEFTIWLYFDKNYKIKRQVDWFEYSPEVMENVLKRYKEKSVEKTPDWLDLSR